MDELRKDAAAQAALFNVGEDQASVEEQSSSDNALPVE
jgi:hypothetical protein